MRVHINMHLSGTIALTDLVKISHMIQPEEYSLEVGHSMPANVTVPVTPNTPIVEPANIEPETPVSDPNEIDAHGWPWSPDLHASTKGTTKDGLWRMKVGVTRPDPKPGFPKTTETPSSTSTTSPASPVADGATAPAGSSPTAEPASAAASPDEEDEFAAFRAAAAKVENPAPVAAPARNYTDADLAKLCNDAAVKLGDPAPVKEVIGQFMPDGVVAHSRNVPAEQRAAFVKAVEEKAGIEFAG